MGVELLYISKSFDIRLNHEWQINYMFSSVMLGYSNHILWRSEDPAARDLLMEEKMMSGESSLISRQAVQILWDLGGQLKQP